MPFILDPSVVLAWLLPDEESEEATTRTELLTAFRTLPLALEPISGESMRRASAFAARRSLSLYDGCYLDLAATRALPLATLDQNHARAAGAEAVSLVLAAPG